MANDFSALKNMIYSGRGITVGMTPNGTPFIGYTLTGRSPPSQARLLVEGEKTGVIRTDVTDPAELQKGSPALLLYPALVPFGNTLIASNGAQTNLIYSAVSFAGDNNNLSLSEILRKAFTNPFYLYDPAGDRWIDLTTYEPDDPNYTPRINALVRGRNAAFHIAGKGDCSKYSQIHAIELEPGKGHLLTTYKGGNEKPLLPFEGSPLEVSVGFNSAEEIAHDLFEATRHGSKPGEDFSVSAAVMMGNHGSGQSLDLRAIVNRHQYGGK